MSTITNQVLRKCYPSLWPWPSGYLQRWRFLFKDHAASLQLINLDSSSSNSDPKNTMSWFTDQGGTVTLTFRLFHPNRYFSIESFQILSFQCIITEKNRIYQKKTNTFCKLSTHQCTSPWPWHCREVTKTQISMKSSIHGPSLFTTFQCQ